MAEIKPSAAADEVHRLTRAGLLGTELRTASADRRRWLRAGAAEIAAPLLFLSLTRRIERGLGHHRCATGPLRLAPDCAERFHDDLDSIIEYWFTHADQPIDRLEGWLVAHLRQATVDGHRRRRGERGALQKPRVPVWLATGLKHDPWLVELATAILEWSGNDATAGTSLWPLGAWAERRAARTGDHRAGEPAVAGEVETVLAAMRGRPTWYEKFVERPLGRKRAPVWLPPRNADGTDAEPEPLVVPPHEQDDAVLRQIASVAIEAMARRLARGDDPAAVVAEVLRTAFGDASLSSGLGRAPGTGDTGPEQVVALIQDPARLDRIIVEVLRVLDDPEGPVTSDR